jgi:hypothetical protein
MSSIIVGNSEFLLSIIGKTTTQKITKDKHSPLTHLTFVDTPLTD